MKRPDDSNAAERSTPADDGDPFTLTRTTATDGDASRTVDWAALSHAVTPTALRHRAIDVSIVTDKRLYAPGEPVSLTVEFRNRFPFPIRVRTDSPNRWRWAVDGHRNASRVPRTVPDRPATFSFARRERKRFRRQWPQRIRVAADEWDPVAPGSYDITVAINRDDAADRGLTDRTEIEIRE